MSDGAGFTPEVQAAWNTAGNANIKNSGLTWTDILGFIDQQSGSGDKELKTVNIPGMGQFSVNYGPIGTGREAGHGVISIAREGGGTDAGPGPDGGGYTDTMVGYGPGVNGEITPISYAINKSQGPLAAFIATVLTAGAASAYLGPGAAAAGAGEGAAVGAGGAGAAAGAGGYAIPTTAELMAGGFGAPGMAMTGAGGIGAAGSVVGAGAGAAGYGAGAAGLGLGAAGAGGGAGGAGEGLTGLTQGTLGGSAGGAGEGLTSLTQGTLGGSAGGAGEGLTNLSQGTLGGSAGGAGEGLTHSTQGVLGGAGGGAGEALTSQTLGTAAGTGAASTLGKALLPKLASALMGGLASPKSGGQPGGGLGLYGASPNETQSHTPGMMAASAAPGQQSQNQQIAQVLLGNPDQPRFGGVGYMQIPDMNMRMAQALQQQEGNPWQA